MVVTTDAPVPDAVVEEIVASDGLRQRLVGRSVALERLHDRVVSPRRCGRSSSPSTADRACCRCRSAPTRRSAPGEVRIEVAAAGINFADVMARMGLYPDAPKTPCVVGYEVAGTILELGEGVQGLSPGQRVLAGTRVRRLRLAGGRAGASDVVPLPDGLSFEQGAAIPVNYGTAWAGLIGYGSLQPGERVLIHSAGGGVGIAATQIAKRAGAEVYGTASPGKHERINELGVDHALDYTQRGLGAGLPQFDVILDAIGGKSFRRSYDAAAPGRAPGRVRRLRRSSPASGATSSTALSTVVRMPRFNLIKQMSESKAVIGLNMLTLWKDRGTLRPWIAPLQEMLDDGTVKPVVGGRVHLRGGRRGAQHDHRAAQRRQGRADPVAAWPRAGGAKLRRRCRSQVSPSRFCCSPLGGNNAWRPRSRIPSREETASETRRSSERHEQHESTERERADRVLIFDTTLRDGEQSPGISLNKQEKLEIAHQLARLGVDVIEAGFPITSPGDFESVQAIAREVEGPVICGLARTQQAGHRGRLERGPRRGAPAHPHVHRDQRHPHRAQAADHARGRQGTGARGGRARARATPTTSSSRPRTARARTSSSWPR